MSGPLTLPSTIRVLERGWLSSNNILLCGANGIAVVDTGYTTHAAQTLSLIQHTLNGQRLDLIVNTHLHSDHCGGNATGTKQASVSAPPDSAASVSISSAH